MDNVPKSSPSRNAQYLEIQAHTERGVSKNFLSLNQPEDFPRNVLCLCKGSMLALIGRAGTPVRALRIPETACTPPRTSCRLPAPPVRQRRKRGYGWQPLSTVERTEVERTPRHPEQRPFSASLRKKRTSFDN
jgi:hypothetical protein